LRLSTAGVTPTRACPWATIPLRQKLVSTTLAALKRLSKKGVVEKLGAGAGVGSEWKLAGA
jgi:hypothetical protein